MSVPQVARAGGTAANAMMVRCGLAALGRIRAAFVVKSRGGTDEAGDRWAPLSPMTIAYRRMKRVRTRTERGRPNRPSQALTKKQQDRWWTVYRQGLVMYKGNKGHAAARAWLILKSEGAQTLLQKYGGANVEILRDTGLLFNSLSPGSAVPERVFRTGPGEVIVGTNRKHAGDHHTGVPSRNLPQRRLWPEPHRWPSLWWLDIAEQGRDGLVDVAISLLT